MTDDDFDHHDRRVIDPTSLDLHPVLRRVFLFVGLPLAVAMFAWCCAVAARFKKG
jgi:hypothetical protein